MGKYDHSELEKEINKVLAYQQKELEDIKCMDRDRAEESIAESEKLLTSLGYKLPEKKSELASMPRKVMIVPNWEELCEEAEKSIQGEVELEALFTDAELKANEAYIVQLNSEFNSLHKLDKFDMAISASAALLGALVDILLVGIPQKTPDGLKAGPLSNYIRGYFDKRFPEAEMEQLANSKVSKVPFDAQDNRHTTVYVEGLSAYYHRLLSLGHDPILGFIIGVADILNGTMTTIDKKGNIVRQVMENYSDRTEKDIFDALSKQIIHFKSDITTSMGLPAPMMALFNLLQFGSIGEEKLTIAEIVQGMYFEGYDFIQFCSMSVPVMVTELVVRLGYAIKRIKEGNSIKDSIPFSTDHLKNPKLGTMLFVAHSGMTAVNAGKVYFTQNPMAINYPEWMAFGKCAYKQLKWVLLEKPEARVRYIEGHINEEMEAVLLDVENTFDDISKDYIVVFN